MQRRQAEEAEFLRLKGHVGARELMSTLLCKIPVRYFGTGIALILVFILAGGLPLWEMLV